LQKHRRPARLSQRPLDHLTKPVTQHFFRSIYASGGMLLNGDDLTQIPAQRLAMLEKFYPPTGKAAVFKNESFRARRWGLKGVQFSGG
jgi:hypothetical protein